MLQLLKLARRYRSIASWRQAHSSTQFLRGADDALVLLVAQAGVANNVNSASVTILTIKHCSRRLICCEFSMSVGCTGTAAMSSFTNGLAAEMWKLMAIC